MGVTELFVLAGIIVLWALAAAVYFLPTIIAFRRRAKRRVGILLLNIFLGVTVLGWVFALVAAIRDATESTGSPHAPSSTSTAAVASASGFCTKCGAVLVNEARFCGKCGQPVESR